MAGVQESYHDLLSSGPEESLSSCYVKVTLKDDRQATCKLYAGDIGNLPRCINCGFCITSWVRLKCHHNLCTECFKTSRSFLCPIDSTWTYKFQASTGSCIYDGPLKDVLIECPWCEKPKVLSSITSHIENGHPVAPQKLHTPQHAVQENIELRGNNELRNVSACSYKGGNFEFSNPEPTKLLQGVTDTKTEQKQHCDHQALADYNHRTSHSRDQEFSSTKQSKPLRLDEDARKERTETCSKEERRDDNFARVDGADWQPSNPEQSKLPQLVTKAEKDNPELRSEDQRQDRSFANSVGKGREILKHEQSKLPPAIVEAKKEHEEAPRKYFIECPICKININANDFEKHQRLCQVQGHNQREALFRVKQEDDRTEDIDLDNEIHELKDRINDLEERLDKIEQPLLLILERLYRNH